MGEWKWELTVQTGNGILNKRCFRGKQMGKRVKIMCWLKSIPRIDFTLCSFNHKERKKKTDGKNVALSQLRRFKHC